MKTFRFLLPLTAFVFAVVVAFATNGLKNESTTSFVYSTCQSCSIDPSSPGDCETDNDGAICKCDNLSTVDAYLPTGVGTCAITRRPR